MVVVEDVDSEEDSEAADSAGDSVEDLEEDSEEEGEVSVEDSVEVEAAEIEAVEIAVDTEAAEVGEDSRPVAKAAPKHPKSPVKKNAYKKVKKKRKEQVDPA